MLSICTVYFAAAYVHFFQPESQYSRLFGTVKISIAGM